MKIQLKKTLQNPLTSSGIFAKLKEYIELDWFNEVYAKNLDIQYYLGHSGDKNISVLFYNLLVAYDIDLDNIVIPNDLYDNLCEIIIANFKDNWNKIYQAYFESTYNPVHNYNMIEIETNNSKIISKQADDIYGFNSVNAVPRGSTAQIVEGNKNDNIREVTKAGNIGVTTSQKLLQSELDVRKLKFVNRLFNDVDTILTSKIY